ncbi:restriction endonuclease subunit S [Paenibacillus sp. SYP-B3998]|uniref:Restriction endonuclease subunit S n=1 Tax=Paenibacillus sp. SYP-B3998 TaxID=2678564 RepID=A0A6G4A6G7_9BACL|nr:restriction endonuclease subunit S [Paenibacillus sp. SYP-B3998]NEW09399.1 restriction endonuclease subunit S [Paenibacillus sp. SYP-B3998]
MTERKKIVPKRRFKEYQDTNCWEQRTVGELTNVASAARVHKEEWASSGIPFFRSSDVVSAYKGKENEKAFISIELYEQLARVSGKLEKDDILITGGGSIGIPYIVPNNDPLYSKDADLIWIKSSEKFNSRYLYTYFTSPEFRRYLRGISHIGTIAHYTIEQVKETPIRLPSIDEQNDIGSYFTQLDHLITLHQRKLEKAKALKSAYLSEMFPAEGEYEPKRRFAGFTDTWEQRKLSEIATMHARIGWQNLRTSEFLDSGEYMLITGTDFEDGAINYSTCHYVEKERYIQDKHIQITNGSILITKDGTLGKVAYVQGLTMPATLNAGVFNVELRDGNSVDGKYLFQYLKAPYLMDYVSKKATGGTIKHLNQNILVDFPVVLPNKEEQTKIGEFFSSLDELITLHQRKLNKLQSIKKAYLNEMFV